MPVLYGTKWGDSQRAGTPGGIVTWSIVDAGVPGVVESFGGRGSDLTQSPDFGSYSVAAQIRKAFDAWSTLADIEFVRVRDDGAPVGEGLGADIRIAFGQIDGAAGSTLALTYFPTAREQPLAGDMLIDSEEQDFYSSASVFLGVVTHELGHALGLDHVGGVRALMNARYQRGVTEPLDDDIAGIQRIYGAQDSHATAPTVGADADLRVERGSDDLRVDGDGRDNRIIGSRADETFRGEGGADLLQGRGGDDKLVGGDGADTVRGGGGEDTVKGNRDDDFLVGGRDDDLLKGGVGADVLNGGRGDDMLVGGSGSDSFVFKGRFGEDFVRDFRPGEDHLDFRWLAGVDGRGDLSFSGGGGGVTISFGHDSIFLRGVAQHELSGDDFLF